MSVSRNVATVLLERVFDNYLWELADDAQLAHAAEPAHTC
jgi:hypothetical protein